MLRLTVRANFLSFLILWISNLQYLNQKSTVNWGEWIYVYVWLSPFAVHLKPSQHCKLTILQNKMFLVLKKIIILKKKERKLLWIVPAENHLKKQANIQITSREKHCALWECPSLELDSLFLRSAKQLFIKKKKKTFKIHHKIQSSDRSN